MMDWLYNKAAEWLVYSPEHPWLFTSLAFWIFFTLLIGLYSIFYPKVRIRNAYLLLVSLFFYYKTGGWFLVLLIFSCLSNYTWGFLIGKSKQLINRKLLLAAGLLTNLGILVYFKYAYFLTGLLNRFTGDAYETYNWLAQWWNSLTNANVATLDIILPIGISFFTFQAISYLVDVYRKHTSVVKNVVDFGFYLSFFPQLVAGPIVRASSFIPQLYESKTISKKEFGHAVFLIMAGLVKKMVISDYLSLNFIDRIFEQPALYSGLENLVAIYAYALQIFCDFSGYTDIAIGVALLMGFKLPINFNSPYKAVSLTDFWHRWHISLSTWLRDYLYIPLGGNRKGKVRTYINLMITMLLGGLWHGANMRFLLWGGLHGLGLSIEKLFGPLRKKLSNTLPMRILFVLLTFHLVCIGWLLFRAESMQKAHEMLMQIAYAFKLNQFQQMLVNYPMVLAMMFFGFTVHWLPFKWQEFIRGSFIKLPIWVKGIIVLSILYLINRFLLADIQPFIYFRF